MALEHVCKWTEHGWVRTNAGSYAREVKRTVHAYEHKLMCEICGQYVTLAYGKIREPYFKHETNEEKSCPDRATLSETQLKALKKEFSLPLKIIIKNSIEFQIGFPSGCMNQKNKSGNIFIERDGEKPRTYTYSRERLDDEKISYLSVGSVPSERYELHDSSGLLKKNCPKVVEGVKASGTLFDQETGKKLSIDADVTIHHKYLLVIRRIGYGVYRCVGLSVKPIKEFGNGWRIYEVSAERLSQDVAAFFQNYHARLTDEPAKLFPIWPACVERPYQVYCGRSERELYFYLMGHYTELNIPGSSTPVWESESSRCYRTLCDDRQKIALVSRTKALLYTYFSRKDLSEFANHSKSIVSVVDENGQMIEPGEQTKLPHKNQINVSMKFDGVAELFDSEGEIIEKYFIKADQNCSIGDIRLDRQLKIFCGQDCVWQVSYKRKERKNKKTSFDRDLLQKLVSFKGDYIPVSRSIGAVAAKFKDNPEICRWLSTQLHSGKISRRAIKLLITKFSEDKKNE